MSYDPTSSHFRALWDATTPYVQDDICVSGNKLWIAAGPNTNELPSTDRGVPSNCTLNLANANTWQVYCSSPVPGIADNLNVQVGVRACVDNGGSIPTGAIVRIAITDFLQWTGRAPRWAAGATYTAGSVILDSNGNLQLFGGPYILGGDTDPSWAPADSHFVQGSLQETDVMTSGLVEPTWSATLGVLTTGDGTITAGVHSTIMPTPDGRWTCCGAAPAADELLILALYNIDSHFFAATDATAGITPSMAVIALFQSSPGISEQGTALPPFVDAGGYVISLLSFGPDDRFQEQAYTAMVLGSPPVSPDWTQIT